MTKSQLKIILISFLIGLILYPLGKYSTESLTTQRYYHTTAKDKVSVCRDFSQKDYQDSQELLRKLQLTKLLEPITPSDLHSKSNKLLEDSFDNSLHLDLIHSNMPLNQNYDLLYISTENPQETKKVLKKVSKDIAEQGSGNFFREFNNLNYPYTSTYMTFSENLPRCYSELVIRQINVPMNNGDFEAVVIISVYYHRKPKLIYLSDLKCF